MATGRRSSLLILLLLSLGAQSGLAVDRLNTDEFVLPKDAEQGEELWLSADIIDLQGTVRADVSAVAQTVTLAGTFDADIWACGTETLIFSGSATDQLRLAGRSVHIEGDARNSLVAIGGTVSLTTNAVLGSTTVLIGDTVVVDGQSEEDLWVIANTATIQGAIEGNLRIIAGDIAIVPGTRIGGDVIYTAPTEFAPGSKVEIGGELIRKEMASGGLSYTGMLLIQVVLFAGALLVAIPFVRLCPRTVLLSGGLLVRSPARCLLVGAAALWIGPFLILLLFIFPVTIPLALVCLSALGLLAYLGQFVVALVIGGLVLQRRASTTSPNFVTALLIGLLILYIVTSVPILSIGFWILIITGGLGALILGGWSSQQVTAGMPQPNPDGSQSSVSDPGEPPD